MCLCVSAPTLNCNVLFQETNCSRKVFFIASLQKCWPDGKPSPLLVYHFSCSVFLCMYAGFLITAYLWRNLAVTARQTPRWGHLTCRENGFLLFFSFYLVLRIVFSVLSSVCLIWLLFSSFTFPFFLPFQPLHFSLFLLFLFSSHLLPFFPPQSVRISPTFSSS